MAANNNLAVTLLTSLLATFRSPEGLLIKEMKYKKLGKKVALITLSNTYL